MKAQQHAETGPRRIKAPIITLLGFAALFAPPAARGSNAVAVFSDVGRDYVRARLPDGSLQPETYAFGEGGFVPGFMAGDTIDKLDFKTIAHLIAAPLARRKFLPAVDPNTTKLLIMVYWGTTSGARDMGFTPQRIELFHFAMLQDRARDMLDYRNASILGYTADGLIGTDEGYWLLQTTALRHRVEDLIDDVEQSRYFVVLMAYDFQMMWKDKQPKLLWVTRLSIDQRRNDFGRELPTMLKVASQYFGRDSHGLIRDVVPEGRVELGEPKPLGVEQ